MIKSSFIKKGGFIFLAIFLLAGFFIFNVSAYGHKNTHPALTYEAAEFYNLNAENSKDGIKKINDEGVSWLMQGAEDEDTPPRWVNHFYNPITGEGWTGEGLGSVDSHTLRALSSLALSSRKPISAKNWAKNQSAQSDYGLYLGDKTWQRAIALYASGDKKGGLVTLGHILHLLEDMTVPDHTRNDTHAGLAGDKGSSYETWAENYTSGKTKSLNIAENLQKQNTKPLNFLLLENYFDINSKYSHDNFLSDDTIFDSDRVDVEDFYKKNIGLDSFIFAKVNQDEFPIVKHSIYSTDKKDYTINDPIILSAYWERLSKQAVISGAGVINLFFKEVEEYKKTNPTPTLPLSKGRERAGVISPFGELVRLNNRIVQLISGTKNFVSKFLPQTGKTQTMVNLDELEGGDTSPVLSETEEKSDGLDSEPSNEKDLPMLQNNKEEYSDKKENGKDEKVVPPQAAPLEENVYVSHVIDGDTVTLNNGKDVRLIGINTPESGDECFEESKEYLKNLVLGKNIKLEKDTSEVDKYGRLLRNIYVDGVFINSEIIKNGYAEVMTVPPDTKYVDDLKILEKEAKHAHRGCLFNNPVGGAGDEISNAYDDRGPYYGGSSSAGAPGAPQDQNSPTIGSPTSDSSAVVEDMDAFVTPTSTSVSATSTLDLILPITPTSTQITSSTPESATSTPAESDPAPAQEKILISEVQVAGGAADDEFVELYNPNGKNISLAGWSIQYRGANALTFYKKNFLAGAEIPAYGFYLVAHKNYSSSGTADMAHSSFSLSSEGGTIFLVRAATALETGIETEIADKVAYYKGEKSETVFIFPETQEVNISDLQSGGSFERKSNASSTAETMAKDGINEKDGNIYDTDNNKNDFTIQQTSNPQSSLSDAEDPTNQHYPPPPEPLAPEIIESEPEGNVLCAFPEFESHKTEGDVDLSTVNLIPKVYAGQTVTLSANTTYYVDAWNNSGESINFIKPGAKLIIEEGVVIKFGPWRRSGWFDFPAVLRVAGSLEVNGTKENPVIFTSVRDNEHGQIIMASSTPAPGDWGALQIESNGSETIKIQNAEFYYGGGHRDNANAHGGAIFINSASADIGISETKFKYSHSGIYINNSTKSHLEILNNNFEYNESFGASSATPLKIIGNTFSCNGLPRLSDITAGVLIKNGAESTIENNNFSSNENFGLYYYPTKGESLNAKNNYWGNASGPRHLSNPSGAGDAVSDNVTFSPWSIKSN
ncbi:MAG: thermonuclease family protein [Candidatus Paceibacterota bacterium]